MSIHGESTLMDVSERDRRDNFDGSRPARIPWADGRLGVILSTSWIARHSRRSSLAFCRRTVEEYGRVGHYVDQCLGPLLQQSLHLRS